MCDSKSKCPPIPTSDTEKCIPEFLRNPVKITREYKAPEGVEIKPIGISGRGSNKRPDYNDNPDPDSNPLAKDKASKDKACKECKSEKETGCATESACADNTGDSNKMEACETLSTANYSSCDAEQVKGEEQCGDELNQEQKVKDLLKYGCDCSLCVKKVEPGLIPELDLREQEPLEVKTDWLMQTPCACSKCIPRKPNCGGEIEDGECFFPTVTCGECGSIRGENASCIMCCFSREMENERKLLDFTCTACGTLTDACQKKDPCVKAKERGLDEFDYDCDGKPIYEGGMSIDRMQHYIWKLGEANGPSGFEQLAFIDCEDDGCEKPEPDDRNCNCAEFERLLAMQSQEHTVNGVPLHEYIYSVPFWGKKEKRDCKK